MKLPSGTSLPTLRQLEYVVAVADERSFGGAAARCHVSQPGLSLQVAEVERLLGVRIFERDRRGVLVTEAGDEIVRRSRTLLESARDLVEAARHRARPLVGRLRMGVIPTIAPYLLPSSLAMVRRDYPELRLTLREEKTDVLVSMLEKGTLDVALLALDTATDRLDCEPLFEDEFVLAMARSHPLAKKKQVSESDLEGERVLLLEDGHCLRDQALAVCNRAGADENADLRATSLATLVPMVSGGDGVTLLPGIAVRSMAGKGSGVEVRPFRKPAPRRRIGLVWRRGSSRADEMRLLARSIVKSRH
ncbi:MAG TPA: hydrogen peroxide-inducible genes activator [Candidatus Limnocylindrales bacterium]|nr:hydrogen peroxide-inducible genes activator [Candidatus Limnocylindrales bacterium]